MNQRETVELVMDAVHRRDFDDLERSGVMHPEVEFYSIVAQSEGSFYRGMDGLREWAVMADDMWEDFRVHLVDVRAGTEGRALIRLRLTGTARGSRVPLDVLVAQVWQWRDGMLWRNVAFSDHDEAARAAGL